MDYQGIHYEARKLWNRGFQSLEILYKGSICANIKERYETAISKLDSAKSPKEIDSVLEWLSGHLAN